MQRAPVIEALVQIRNQTVAVSPFEKKQKKAKVVIPGNLARKGVP
jgi:hypothetical protein